MHAVTSNAVAIALGGKQIKTHQFNITINAYAGGGYAYAGGIPPEIEMNGQNCNVIGCSMSWGNIGDSKGMQIQLINISGSGLEKIAYLNYYKPSVMDSAVTVQVKIYYIV